jgi:hypothetical protein
VRNAAILAVIIAALGVPVGVLWWLVSPQPKVTVVAGGLTLSETEAQAFVAAEGWFAILTLAAGIICGLVVAFLGGSGGSGGSGGTSGAHSPTAPVAPTAQSRRSGSRPAARWPRSLPGEPASSSGGCPTRSPRRRPRRSAPPCRSPSSCARPACCSAGRLARWARS